MRTLSILAAALAAACTSTPEAGSTRDGAASDPRAALEAGAAVPSVDAAATIRPTPWTRAFLGKGVLLCDHLRIEGPDGLLEHLVVSSDDAWYERRVTHEGNSLVQTTLRRDESVPEIRVQLDNWQMAACRQVTVVEHLGEVPVTVIASGDAVFSDTDGKEQRSESLRFVGTIGE